MEKRYLVHLDEEAVNEVPRVLWVKRCFVDLHPRGNEVLELFYQVVDAIVSSWQVLHDPGIHVIQLWGISKGSLSAMGTWGQCRLSLGSASWAQHPDLGLSPFASWRLQVYQSLPPKVVGRTK